MKLQLPNFVIPLLSVLIISACKKSKTSPEPQGERISITKAADDNTEWELQVDALAAERSTIWIDKNSNGTKDTGEPVNSFGTSITIPYSGSRTLNIYGKLSYFGCSGNELTAVDVSKSTGLLELDCAFNRLTALNLTNNTGLENLDCSYNELPALSLTQNTALKDLSCAYNKLTSLNVSQNTQLISLFALKNLFPTIDVSKNLALQFLDVSNSNTITTLNLSTNTALRELHIYRNAINSSNMQQLISSLPARSAADKGKLYLFYIPDGNSLPGSASVSSARSKNWILYKFETSWQEMP